MQALLAWSFVAGTFLLQQCEALPAASALDAAAAGALAAAAVAAAASLWRRGDRDDRDDRAASRRRRVATRGLLLAAAVVAGFDHAAWRAQTRVDDQLARQDELRDVRVTGVVATLPEAYDDAVRFEFDIERIEASSAPLGHVPRHVSVSWYEPPPDVRAAQRWTLTLRLKRPHAALNPAGFDAESFLFERNLRATATVRARVDAGRDDAGGDDVGGAPGAGDSGEARHKAGAGTAGDHGAPRLVDPLVADPSALVDRGRQALRDALGRALAGRRYAPVLVALVMGDQGGVSTDDWALFNRTGIGHLVSISGTHITMVAGLGALAAAALWRRSPRLLHVASVPAVRATAGAVTALAYCLLAGWGVPAQRTFFMLATLALLLPSRARIGGGTALAFAAAVVCLLDPWAVVSAGFWLSFGAVATILFAMHGRLGEASGWRARLMEAGRIQWTVTAGLVPATVVIFQQVSLVSPIANALAIPVVGLVVTPLALAGAALLGLPDPAPWCGARLLELSHLVFALCADALEALLRIPYASVSVAAPPAWTLAFAVAGLAWALAPPGWPMRAAGFVGMLPMLAGPGRAPLDGDLWVTALDVGQGMALLLESAKAVVLFDTGPRIAPGIDAGVRAIVPYARWRGIDRIDLLVVSHLDSDHSGGARSVLAALGVGRVVTSIDATDPALAGAGRVERCEAGRRLDIGDLAIEVLHPDAGSYARRQTTNQRSCVIAVARGAWRILLTGDVPAREERALVRAGAALRADLLVAPHHGSRTSSSDELIAAAAPRWVSVQAAYRSRFGHPHPEVLQRYAAHGAQVVRSDLEGAVTWRFGAEGRVEVERWRRDHAHYWNDRPFVEDGGPAARAGGK